MSDEAKNGISSTATTAAGSRPPAYAGTCAGASAAPATGPACTGATGRTYTASTHTR